MKKLGVLLMSLVLLVSLSSCSKNEEKSEQIKVGVVQLVEHPALDEATKGFVDL